MACTRSKRARFKGGVAVYARTSSKTNENGVQVPDITWRYVKLCMMLWWCKLQVQAPNKYCNMAGKPSKAYRECSESLRGEQPGYCSLSEGALMCTPITPLGVTGVELQGAPSSSPWGWLGGVLVGEYGEC